MIEIENILNAAKGAAGAKKIITTLFSVDFATISDSSNLKKNRLRRVAHMSRGTHAF